MLLKSLKALGITLTQILHTRLELFSLDVKEAKIRFVSVLILGAFSVLLLSLGIILGVFWLIITFWEFDRLFVMGGLTALLLGSGLILMVMLFWKLRHGPKLFESTIAELTKDRMALGNSYNRGNP